MMSVASNKINRCLMVGSFTIDAAAAFNKSNPQIIKMKSVDFIGENKVAVSVGVVAFSAGFGLGMALRSLRRFQTAAHVSPEWIQNQRVFNLYRHLS
jgi:hypothetical protein